jgi:hypothetical protein
MSSGRRYFCALSVDFGKTIDAVLVANIARSSTSSELRKSMLNGSLDLLFRASPFSCDADGEAAWANKFNCCPDYLQIKQRLNFAATAFYVDLLLQMLI